MQKIHQIFDSLAPICLSGSSLDSYTHCPPVILNLFQVLDYAVVSSVPSCAPAVVKSVSGALAAGSVSAPGPQRPLWRVDGRCLPTRPLPSLLSLNVQSAVAPGWLGPEPGITRVGLSAGRGCVVSTWGGAPADPGHPRGLVPSGPRVC